MKAKDIIKTIVLLGITAYMLLMVTGRINPGNRLGAQEYALIAFIVLIVTGFFEKLTEFSFNKDGVSFRLDKIEDRQDVHEGMLTAIQITLKGLVTKYEYVHMLGLNQASPYLCRYGDIFFEEVKRLDATGFIAPSPAYLQRGFNAVKDENQTNPGEFDLKKYVVLTREGEEYLKIRELLKNKE
jgi:hypothetical protein